MYKWTVYSQRQINMHNNISGTGEEEGKEEEKKAGGGERERETEEGRLKEEERKRGRGRFGPGCYHLPADTIACRKSVKPALW